MFNQPRAQPNRIVTRCVSYERMWIFTDE